jgi:hypothetical protein
MVQVRDIGFQWQGRYTMPLAVGVPILAGFSLSESARARLSTRRISYLLIVAFTLAQLVAFWQPLRSYSVGKNGTIWFFTRARWDPPIPSVVLLLVYTAATALLLANALLVEPSTRRSPPRGGGVEAKPTTNDDGDPRTAVMETPRTQ